MKLNSLNLNLSLRHLRALHAIRAQGTFARAAGALGIVPSALTEIVRQAEAEVGAPLFDRRMRPAVPTPLGDAFLNETAPLLTGFDRALERVREQAGLTKGRLAVGAAPSAISGIVGPAIARFHQKHPGIQCLLHDDIADRLGAMVVDGGLDLAVAGPARENNDVIRTELRRDPFGLACRADDPMAAQEAIDIGQIPVDRLISLSLQTGTQQLLLNAPDLPAALHKGLHTAMMQAHSTIAQLAMIRAGLGYALMPRDAVAVLGDPQIRFLPLRDFTLWRRLFLLEPARRARSHVATIFIQDFLRK